MQLYRDLLAPGFSALGPLAPTTLSPQSPESVNTRRMRNVCVLRLFTNP
jgi:hypothetical protein